MVYRNNDKSLNLHCTGQTALWPSGIGSWRDVSYGQRTAPSVGKLFRVWCCCNILLVHEICPPFYLCPLHHNSHGTWWSKYNYLAIDFIPVHIIWEQFFINRTLLESSSSYSIEHKISRICFIVELFTLKMQMYLVSCQKNLEHFYICSVSNLLSDNDNT